MIAKTIPLIHHYEIKPVINKNPYLLGERYVNKKVWMVEQTIPHCKPKQIDYWTNFKKATRFLKSIGATWSLLPGETKCNQSLLTKRKWIARV